MQPSSGRRIILIEGMPGCGKSTMAAAACDALEGAGLPARWWREEASLHPTTPASLRKRAREAGFAAHCLTGWEAFVASLDERSPIHVLEGSAFQSTIRFMLEQDLPVAEIETYLARFDRLVTATTALFVYLYAPSPGTLLAHTVIPQRGPAWTSKVAAYLATTRLSRARQWRGTEGMIQFWIAYHELCERLLPRLSMPVVRIEVGPGKWAEAEAQLRSLCIKLCER